MKGFFIKGVIKYKYYTDNEFGYVYKERGILDGKFT
jgi:hypothetical protein